MRYDPNFSLEQATVSETAERLHIPNVPGDGQLANLRVLWITLSRVPELLACPIDLSSVYRCPALNKLVGGAVASAHLDGRAADLVPEGIDLSAAFESLRDSDLPYDQLIIEQTRAGARWIHLGIAPIDQPPRRQALSASGDPGAMTYRESAG